MSKIKAVIFDMDGVLIDAKNWHYHALNKALSLFGMEISKSEHLSTYDGLPTKKKLELLTQDRNLPRKLHPFINDLKQHYTLETVYTECKPVFYHLYALSQLKKMGYKIVVCSNSIRKTVETMMERSNLDVYLEFYLSNEDVRKPKPDPEMYNMAIKRLQLKPEECLVVEDNIHGVQAALASGAHLLKVLDVEDVNIQNVLNKIKEVETLEVHSTSALPPLNEAPLLQPQLGRSC